MEVDWEDYKGYTKRTCTKCGLRGPQPFMHKQTAAVEVAQGKSGLSLRTVLGAILGYKRSSRQLGGFFLAPNKRSYTRKRTFYTCEKCVGKKTAATQRLEKGGDLREKRGTEIGGPGEIGCLFVTLVCGGFIASVWGPKSAPDSDSQSVTAASEPGPEFPAKKTISASYKRRISSDSQSVTEGSEPASVGRLESPEGLTTQSNNQLPPVGGSDTPKAVPSDTVTTKRFRIELEDCFIREVIGQSKTAFLNKRPKSGYVYVVVKWSFANETTEPLPTADAPSTRFVDARGGRIDPDKLATRKMRWELDLDSTPTRVNPVEKVQVVTVFEVEHARLNVETCHAEFLDNGEDASLSLKTVFSSR